jgi:hypothetical protein
MDDFLHILRILLYVLVRFLLFFYCKLRMASTAFMIIESCKMTSFPSIKPMIDRETIDIKDVHKISSCPTLKTEENTMSTLSDSMMLTLFIASPE